MKHRIGGVPLVEDDQVIGVITESDLFRLIVTQETWHTAPSAEAAAGVS